MTSTDLINLNGDPTRTPNKAIAIDFDGVITRPHAKKAAAFSAAGYDITPADTSRKQCLDQTEMSEGVYEQIVRTINVPELDSVPLNPEVSDGLERLTAAGFCPVIVTSRYDTEVGAMRQYIIENELPVFGYLNTGRQPKRNPIEELGAEAFIDDSASKLEPFLGTYSTQTELFFFQHEANSNTTPSRKTVSIVESWQAFVDAIIES